MANIKFNKLYESWQRYTRGAGLLLEAEMSLYIEMNPADFLKLTTTAEDMERIIKNPSISEPFDTIKAGTLSLAIELDDMGIGKVREHEGRNRSFKAIQAGLNKVPVQLMILNRKASLGEIKALQGQFSDVKVNASKFSEKKLTVNADDPLGIGAGKDIKGYEIKVDWATIEGIKGYLNTRYNKEPAFQQDGKAAFADNILNKYYKVIDDTGQQYSFANSPSMQVDASGKVAKTGLLALNLVPHPLTLMASPNMDELNNRTFKLIKR